MSVFTAVFVRVITEQQCARQRCAAEYERTLAVLENRLRERDYIVGTVTA